MVTGAGRSIGRAVAERFHAAGARVHICCLTTESLEDVLGANPGMSGSIADVGSGQAVARWFDEGLAALGGLDVLVNNAGISGPRAPIDEIEDDDWYRVIDVNLHGMFHCIKRAVPAMKARGGGAIVNISTASTRVGMPLRTSYVTSKCAVDGMTRNLARELGPFGIRCNAVLPGIVDNPRGRRLIAQLADERQPDHRGGARALCELHLDAHAHLLRGGRRRRVLPGAGRGPQHHRAADRGLRQSRMGGVGAYFLRKRSSVTILSLSPPASGVTSPPASCASSSTACGRRAAALPAASRAGPNCRPNFTEGSA